MVNKKIIHCSQTEGFMEKFFVERKKISSYKMFLKENYRPPSRGGNTNALHSHVIEVDGEKYSFLALGSQQWIYKNDIVSFEYKVENNYKNIVNASIVTTDKKGQEISRGNRGFKQQLRSK